MKLVVEHLLTRLHGSFVETEYLRNRFTFPDPDAKPQPGEEVEHPCLIQEQDGYLVFLTGLLDRVRDTLTEGGFEVTIEDNRSWPSPVQSVSSSG